MVDLVYFILLFFFFTISRLLCFALTIYSSGKFGRVFTNRMINDEFAPEGL